MSRMVMALAVVITLFAPIVVFAQGATDCTFPGHGHGVGGTPGRDGSSGTFPGGGHGPCKHDGGHGGNGGGGTPGGMIGGGGYTGGGGGTIHATASEPTMILTLAAGLLLAGALRRR